MNSYSFRTFGYLTNTPKRPFLTTWFAPIIFFWGFVQYSFLGGPSSLNGTKQSLLGSYVKIFIYISYFRRWFMEFPQDYDLLAYLIVWGFWLCFRYLLPLLLQYDSTAEESDPSESPGVGASVQIAKNLHAVRAAQALSRLSGLSADERSTPYNQDAAASLRALLTPKLASMLKDNVPKDLLSRLNTNLESPEVYPPFEHLLVNVHSDCRSVLYTCCNAGGWFSVIIMFQLA